MNQILRLATWIALVCVQLAEPGHVVQTHSNSSDAEGSPGKLSSKHLPNLVQVHPKVISGGLPEGEAAFEELRKLGVGTVICVDGAKPDVATAARFGMKYVHLPHGYDGIPEQRALELAKAVRDLDGRIYIHCHHGRHRSPAAASVACVSAGMISPEAAHRVLLLAETSPHYRGLFSAAQNSRPIPAAQLDEFTAGFRETVDVPPLAEAMVAMERSFERLELMALAGWRQPAEHPDLDPAHEALLLREQFTEMMRIDGIGTKPAKFRQLLSESEEVANELETALRRRETRNETAVASDPFDRAMTRIEMNCTLCHQRFRDAPLREE